MAYFVCSETAPSEGGKRNGVHLKALLDLIGRRPASKKAKQFQKWAKIYMSPCTTSPQFGQGRTHI